MISKKYLINYEMIGGIDKEIKTNDNLDLKPVKSTSKKFIDLKFFLVPFKRRF